jgi:hypothetical protein
LVVVAVMVAITLAPTAHAEPNEQGFIDDVAREIPGVLARYGRQAVIAEGYRICVYGQWESEGLIDYTNELDRIILDMPMSNDDAIAMTTTTIGTMCKAGGGTM